MNSDTYRIILSGKIPGNRDAEAVKGQISKLFKISSEVVEKLFSGRKTIVRKDLDLETANKYVRAIQKAGADCYMEKMAVAAPAQTTPATEEAPAGSGGLKVIPVQTAYKGEERFFPQQMDKLTASANGLSFDAENFLDVDYNRIAAMAAYSPLESNGDSIRFLLYIKENERPFLFDAGSIDYKAFQKDAPAKTAAAFRGYLHFLCRQNTSMILEETTFDFLSGNPLPGYNDEKAMKYATAIGKLVEEGGDGEEG